MSSLNNPWISVLLCFNYPPVHMLAFSSIITLFLWLHNRSELDSCSYGMSVWERSQLQAVELISLYTPSKLWLQCVLKYFICLYLHKLPLCPAFSYKHTRHSHNIIMPATNFSYFESFIFKNREHEECQVTVKSLGTQFSRTSLTFGLVWVYKCWSTHIFLCVLLELTKCLIMLRVQCFRYEIILTKPTAQQM